MILLILVLLAGLVHGQTCDTVLVQTQSKFYNKSELFSVKVNGKPSFVEQNGHVHHTNFVFHGSAKIEIQLSEDVSNYSTSPKHLDIQSFIDNNVISLTIHKPTKIILHQINDWSLNNNDPRLLIFANGLEERKPDLSDSKVFNIREYEIDATGQKNMSTKIQNLIEKTSDEKGILYFPPGLYQFSSLNMQDDVTIYLDQGATLKVSDQAPARMGAILFEDVEKAHIIGQGTIDGNGLYLKYDGNGPKKGCSIIRASNADNCSLEGITLKNPGAQSLFIRQSQDWMIKNIKLLDLASKALSKDAGEEGIVFDDCKFMLIDEVMVLCGKMSLFLKSTGLVSRYSDMDNINIRNSVFWAGYDKPAIQIGPELSTFKISNLTFENIDIIKGFYGIWQSTNMHQRKVKMSDIYYKNIRLEEIENAFLTLVALNGAIEKTFFQNIILFNRPSRVGVIQGANEENGVKHVRFENIIVNNKPLVDKSEFQTDQYVRDFAVTQKPAQKLTLTRLTNLKESSQEQAAFVIKRAGPTKDKVKVPILLSGTAQNGEDYKYIEDQITIPDGADSVRVFIEPLKDDIDEGWETLVLRIGNNPDDMKYLVDHPYQASICIVDD